MKWRRFSLLPVHGRRMICLLFLAGILLASGCGRWSLKDRVDLPPNAEKIGGVRRVGQDPPPSYVYRIGVGDTISLRFFYYQDMIDPAIVVPSDGFVQLPLLGPVQVLGYAENELNALLQEKYAERLMFPDLVARIAVRSHDGVYMDGATGNVGTLPYDNHLTLLESLKKTYMGAGAGSLRSVIVIRGLNTPQYVSFRVNANKILDGKESDIYLEPNDIVYIPKKFILDVNYFVEHYIDNVLGRHIAPAQVFPQAFPYRADIQTQFAIDFVDIK
jgi:protein involved in polysaccharide export with SLBB domain